LTAYGENEKKNEVLFNIRTAEISFIVQTAPEPHPARGFSPKVWVYLTNNPLVIAFELFDMNYDDYKILRKGCLNFNNTHLCFRVKRWNVNSVSEHFLNQDILTTFQMQPDSTAYQRDQSNVGPNVAATGNSEPARKSYLTRSTASAAGRGMKSKDPNERKQASQTMAAWRKRQAEKNAKPRNK